MKENTIIGIFMWIIGVIVALAVGSQMIDQTLIIPGIPKVITFITGWVVVMGTITSSIILIFTK